MAGKTTFLEKAVLNGLFVHPTTAVSGSNASTSSILCTSSASFYVGALVKLTTPGSYHLVTSIPDGTHVNISPSAGAAPTTGNIEIVGYAPPGIYVGLFTALPSDAGGGTEVSTGNYARQQVVQNTTNWNAVSGSPSQTSNVTDIQWAAVTWSGTVVAWGLFDSLSGGNLLAWFDCADQAVAATNTVKFTGGAPGQLVVTED